MGMHANDYVKNWLRKVVMAPPSVASRTHVPAQAPRRPASTRKKMKMMTAAIRRTLDTRARTSWRMTTRTELWHAWWWSRIPYGGSAARCFYDTLQGICMERHLFSRLIAGGRYSEIRSLFPNRIGFSAEPGLVLPVLLLTSRTSSYNRLETTAASTSIPVSARLDTFRILRCRCVEG